jgi:hypothetical protein
MKKLILVALAFASSSAFACECARPNFKEKDISKALETYMAQELKVKASLVRSVTKTEERSYLTRLQQIGLFTFETFEKNGFVKACNRGCEESMNRDQDYEVSYLKGDQECLVNLHLIITSNMTNEKFKARVAPMAGPICD